ncbi:hypothetical protein VTO73DRAFT_10188 [Trametes versicolor]
MGGFMNPSGLVLFRIYWAFYIKSRLTWPFHGERYLWYAPDGVSSLRRLSIAPGRTLSHVCGFSYSLWELEFIAHRCHRCNPVPSSAGSPPS